MRGMLGRVTPTQKHLSHIIARNVRDVYILQSFPQLRSIGAGIWPSDPRFRHLFAWHCPVR